MDIFYHHRGRDENFKIWHTVSEGKHMIIYFHSDGGSVVCSENIYPISPGVICFIGSSKYHYTMPNDIEKYDRSKLFFDKSLISLLLPAINGSSLFEKFDSDALVYAKIPEDKQEETEKIFGELAAVAGTPHESAALAASVIRLLTLIDGYSVHGEPTVKGTIGAAVEYINKNILSDMTIDDVCKSVHLSKYHFCRKFKHDMGMTVMDYILRTRIVLAKNMLEKESSSITEVSEACGFSSISYFCRSFKSSTGLSPLKYRRAHRK